MSFPDVTVGISIKQILELIKMIPYNPNYRKLIMDIFETFTFYDTPISFRHLNPGIIAGYDYLMKRQIKIDKLPIPPYDSILKLKELHTKYNIEFREYRIVEQLMDDLINLLSMEFNELLMNTIASDSVDSLIERMKRMNFELQKFQNDDKIGYVFDSTINVTGNIDEARLYKPKEYSKLENIIRSFENNK